MNTSRTDSRMSTRTLASANSNRFLYSVEVYEAIQRYALHACDVISGVTSQPSDVSEYQSVYDVGICRLPEIYSHFMSLRRDEIDNRLSATSRQVVSGSRRATAQTRRTSRHPHAAFGLPAIEASRHPHPVCGLPAIEAVPDGARPALGKTDRNGDYTRRPEVTTHGHRLRAQTHRPKMDTLPVIFELTRLRTKKK